MDDVVIVMSRVHNSIIIAGEIGEIRKWRVDRNNAPFTSNYIPTWMERSTRLVRMYRTYTCMINWTSDTLQPWDMDQVVLTINGGLSREADMNDVKH